MLQHRCTANGVDQDFSNNCDITPPPSVCEGSETSSDSDSCVVVSEKDDKPTQTAANPHNKFRIFSYQESITNTLISTDPNFQALHDVFLIQILLISCFTLIRDSYTAGRLYLNISLFSIGFGSYRDIGTFAIIELILQLWAFIIHPLLKVWEKYRGVFPILLDALFLTIYVFHMSIAFVATFYIVSFHSLPHLINFIIGIEQFRLSMKSYSFIRENAYKVLYPWHKDDTSGPAVWYAGQMSPTVGSFSQYVYFLFSPTLLYRDHYPRKNTISIRIVMFSFLQFILALWSSVFILTNVIYPQSMRQEDVLHSLLMSLVMAFALKILGHTSILNGYLNMSAELTRFADRQFFSEWWACTSYSSYYRKWNSLVHDWIHSYLYLDLKKTIGRKAAVFSTILASSIVHEYLLSMGVGYVFPVVTFLFASVGMFFYILKPVGTRRASNLFLLCSLNVGFTIIVFSLVMEFAARNYCPVHTSTLSTTFTPQLFSCYWKHNALKPYNSTVTNSQH